MTTGRLAQGVEFLANNGYNIFSSTACRSLPADIIEYLGSRGIDLKKFPALVVIGSGGKRLWEAIHYYEEDSPHSGTAPFEEHPVNHFTAGILERFIQNYLDDSETITLFPSQPPRPFDSPDVRRGRSGFRPTGEKEHRASFPMQTFAHWLGLAHPTPLGKNIHKEFGLWHAYRSVFLTALELPETPRQHFRSPCDTCVDKPCIKVCPAGAVGEVKQTLTDFNRTKCFTFRLTEDSICADRCLSRMACPVAREHKYTMKQMNHHYLRSRRSIIEKHNTDYQYGYAATA